MLTNDDIKKMKKVFATKDDINGIKGYIKKFDNKIDKVEKNLNGKIDNIAVKLGDKIDNLNKSMVNMAKTSVRFLKLSVIKAKITKNG